MSEDLPLSLFAVLQGLAIGNGLTQPDIQYEAYADYALDMNLISAVDHDKLSKLFPACAASIKLCGEASSDSVRYCGLLFVDHYC